MTKLYSSKDLTRACTLYRSLQFYEDRGSAFLNPNENMENIGFNHAQRDHIKDLIVKVEEVENLKHEPIFKNCINKLIVLYNLNNLL